MGVCNMHEWELPVSGAEAGLLIDGLSGGTDPLWPRHDWPAMLLDGPPAPGAAGGHGPVHYTVAAYVRLIG